MVQLSGSTQPVRVDEGYTLRTPGFSGTAVASANRALDPSAPGEEEATAAFDEALASANLSEERTFVVRGEHVPIPPQDQVRTLDGTQAMVLEVPDPGPEFGQVAMVIDEGGAISWSYPTDTAGDVPPTRVRSLTPTTTFVIRSTPTQPSGDAGERSLVGNLGKKVVKVFIFPIAGTVLQTAARFFARKWEERNRPYGIRWFGPDEYRQQAARPIADADWDILAAGRSLLFVHGTFSSAYSGFHGLPRATMEALDARYEGRVFAFDHFTLSHDPQRNLVEFLDRIPDTVQLELDLISHSRGGLLARTIAGELGPSPSLSVDRSVLVAAPNHGTALADPKHMSSFIDRHTSMLNLIPPAGPPGVVVEILESIITAVKMIGTSALEGLPGLASMDPRGDFLSRLNRGEATASRYYAMASNYEPKGGLKDLVADGVVDRVFLDADNDLVVPTTGVFSGSADPHFPIPAGSLERYGPSDAIAHNRFFSHPPTSEALLDWLQ